MKELNLNLTSRSYAVTAPKNQIETLAYFVNEVVNISFIDLISFNIQEFPNCTIRIFGVACPVHIVYNSEDFNAFEIPDGCYPQAVVCWVNSNPEAYRSVIHLQDTEWYNRPLLDNDYLSLLITNLRNEISDVHEELAKREDDTLAVTHIATFMMEPNLSRDEFLQINPSMSPGEYHKHKNFAINLIQELDFTGERGE